MRPVAAFRFEAGPAIGEGHRIRSYALSEWLRQEFEIRFPDDGSPVDLLVVDGYGYSTDWIRHQCQRASCILQIVDSPNGPYAADALVNPSHDAHPDAYPACPHTEHRLGNRYRLLRPEFLAPVPTEPRSGIWFAPGGTDAAGISSEWMPWLIRHQPEPVRMALSSTSDVALRNEMTSLRDAHPDRFFLHIDADAQTLVREMDRCRVAICTSSGVFWEAASRRLPVATGMVAENQAHVYGDAVERWGAIPLGDMKQIPASEVLAFLSRTPKAVADPMGGLADDWASWCRLLVRRPRLRPATLDDARCLYEWSMDPTVRAQSLNPAAFSYEEHVTWLRQRLSSDQSRIFIAEWRNVPCGTIRFDQTPAGDWKLSYLLAAEHRGRGLAHGLVAAGMRAMEGHRMFAQVKSENTASLRVFRSAGWAERLHDGLHHFSHHFESTE